MHAIQEWFNLPASRERILLSTIGLVQGIAVWLVIRTTFEPGERTLYDALLTFVLCSGLLFQFASSTSAYCRLSYWVLAFAVPFALVTYHAERLLPLTAYDYQGDSFRVRTWMVAGLLAVYILLPYLQIYQRTGKPVFPYHELYQHSWNNFFIAGLGWFYTGIYWILLWICAVLFKSVGITAIQTLITKPSFIAITTAAMGGLGVALAKEHAQIITTLRMIAATLIRSLTPLLVIIVMGFIGTLLFTGLHPLWETKWASAILLAVLLIILLFVNAVFQDGTARHPYGRLLQRGVEAMLLVMPLLVGLTLYSMHLRIAQHGFTPERYYAIVFALVLGAYSIGYALCVVRRDGIWLGGIRRYNIALSFVVLGLAFALHTPLMDPLKRSAEDQERRLLTGRVDVAHFDFTAMRYQFGHYGQAVLDRLVAQSSHPEHQQIVERIKHVRAGNPPPALPTDDELLDRLTVVAPTPVPKAALAALRYGAGWLLKSCSPESRCDLVAGQWDDDQDLEYVFVSRCIQSGESCDSYSVVQVKKISSAIWKSVALIQVAGNPVLPTRAETVEAALKGHLAFKAAQYHCMTVGEQRACDGWGKGLD